MIVCSKASNAMKYDSLSEDLYHGNEPVCRPAALGLRVSASPNSFRVFPKRSSQIFRC
jgi:hypothetical protein